MAAPDAAQITRWRRRQRFEDAQSACAPAPGQRAPGRRRHPPAIVRHGLVASAGSGTLRPCCGCRTAPWSTSAGCPAGNGPRSAGCTDRNAGSGSGRGRRAGRPRRAPPPKARRRRRRGRPGPATSRSPAAGTWGCRAAHSLTSRRSAGRGVPSASDRSTSDHTASRSARASASSSDEALGAAVSPASTSQRRGRRGSAAARGATRAGRPPWRPGRARGCRGQGGTPSRHHYNRLS